ncbi:MAG: DUF5666 domain-containing protein [Pseudomonadales bacterium]|jgi:hypothetical protein|nr:DUF5666 domain-containing protein [Pseudomonadales bacterium]
MKTTSACAILVAAILMQGCGGGSSAPAPVAGGGAPPPAAPPPAGGVGGERAGLSAGTITGFGSIIVNGVRYETDSATILDDDDAIDETSLAVGEYVVVTGTVDQDGTTRVASRVLYDAEVEGPISSIDEVGSRFVVLGRTVIVDGATVFDGDDFATSSIDGLTVGDRVEVSGLLAEAGAVLATRIELSDDTDFEVKGFVSDLDSGAATFRIGTQTVDFGSAVLEDFDGAVLADGQFVEVRADALVGDVLEATLIELEDALAFLDVDSGEGQDREFDFEGVITAVEGDLITVGPVVVRIAPDADFGDGSREDLVVGARVELEGDVSAEGELIADEVGLREAVDSEVEGLVETIDLEAGAFTLPGVTVNVSPSTQFEDDSELDLRAFSLADLVVGDFVEVRGVLVEGSLVAVRVERDDEDQSGTPGEGSAPDPDPVPDPDPAPDPAPDPDDPAPDPDPVVPPPANAAPMLTLAAPSPSASVVIGDSVTLSASASDAEDGDISASIAWDSSLDGALGTGSSVTANDLSLGNHTITARVTDSQGSEATESQSVSVRGASTSVDRSKYHVFGNSLFTYDGGDLAPNSVYTRAGTWLGRLAGFSAKEAVGSFTFGFYSNFNALDWGSASSVRISGNYNEGGGNTPPFTGDFSAQDYTHFLSMPSNFLEDEMGGPPYDRPVDNTRLAFAELDSNIDLYYPEAEHFLYVHWPDASVGYAVGATGSRADFAVYNNNTIGEYLGWHIRLQDSLEANGVSVRTIPAGPVIAWLFENEPYLTGLDFYDVYGDDAPHGSENIYLLAALVVYQVIYGEQPDLSSFTIPSGATQIRPEIAGNLPAISAAIEARLEFHQSNGVNVR